MRKMFFAVLCGALTILSGIAADLYHPPSCDIMASEYGTRTGTTLTNIITQVGSTRKVNLILDGGTWDITNNVTFSKNIGLTVCPGSYMQVTSGVTVTFQTNDLVAGHYTVFSGLGLATGTVTGTGKFIFLQPDWGSNSWVNIGLGDVNTNVYVGVNDLGWRMTNAFPNLETNATSSSYSLSNILNTANNAYNQQGTNFSRVQAVTGAFTTVSATTMSLSGTLNVGSVVYSSMDMLTNFLGLPKITLTTAMVTSTDDSTAPALPADQFGNAFDNNLTTWVPDSTNDANASSHHYYMIDLATQYVGFAFIQWANISGNEGSCYFSITRKPTFSNSIYPQSFGPTQTNGLMVPFTGRYIWISPYAAAAVKYTFSDISVWGVTNGFTSMGGF